MQLNISSANNHNSSLPSHNSTLNYSDYTNLIIYYYSGTGNAKSAAGWIADVAKSRNINTHIISIHRYEEIQVPRLKEGKTLIGFCYPTHGFDPAPLMLKFIIGFPALKNCNVFLLNTRAGMKLSKLFLPGISGLAQIIPAAILRAKGFKVIGMQPMDLPSNWISLHPGLKQKVVESIFSRCKRISERFANKILSGKRHYKALLSLPIDVAVSPISVGYYFIGRFAIAKTFYASEKCTNCGKCIEQCPVKAIKLVNNRPFWKYNCESCMKCMNNCTERAIETSHGYFALMWYLAASFVIPFILFEVLGGHIFGLDKHSVVNEILFTLIDWSLWLTVIILGYEIMHRLLRVKFINKLIRYTSLTTFKFWRRYKAPRIWE